MLESQFIVYGTDWCGDCIKVRRFLDRKNIAYQWIDIDHNKAAEAYVIRTNGGYRSVPTIIFPDGSKLVEPSLQNLADKLDVAI